jgi:hypothetical protein
MAYPESMSGFVVWKDWMVEMAGIELMTPSTSIDEVITKFPRFPPQSTRKGTMAAPLAICYNPLENLQNFSSSTRGPKPCAEEHQFPRRNPFRSRSRGTKDTH